MRWEQGRAAVERMLADGELQRVPASRQQSERLLAQARVRVASALKVCDEDSPGGYALACDGARKALTAILENEGLRPTTRGGIGAAIACEMAGPMHIFGLPPIMALSATVVQLAHECGTDERLASALRELIG